MIQGALLAYPADPSVRRRPRGAGEVALRDRRPHVHLRDPRHGAPLLLDRRAALLAADRRLLQRARAAVFLAMAMYAYYAIRRSGSAHPNRMALHWTIGSAIFSALGAGLLGLAHTWPAVNKWTHGTLITPMHGHMAFFGAYVMIVLGMITYATARAHGAAARTRGRRLAGLLVLLAADRRHVRHDDGVRRGRHHADVPGAHPRHRLPRDPAEAPGALPDAGGHRRRVRRRRRAVPLGLLLPAPAAR